mgnify:CR=1 FL=1
MLAGCARSAVAGGALAVVADYANRTSLGAAYEAAVRDDFGPLARDALEIVAGAAEQQARGAVEYKHMTEGTMA